MARIKGNKVGIYIVDEGSGAQIVGLSKNVTINIARDTVEVAGNSSQSKSYRYGRMSYTVEIECLYHYRDSPSYNNLMKLIHGENLSFKIAILPVSEGFPFREIFGGEALITNYSFGAPVEGYATVSMTLLGTGDLNVNF